MPTSRSRGYHLQVPSGKTTWFGEGSAIMTNYSVIANYSLFMRANPEASRSRAISRWPS